MICRILLLALHHRIQTLEQSRTALEGAVTKLGHNLSNEHALNDRYQEKLGALSDANGLLEDRLFALSESLRRRFVENTILVKAQAEEKKQHQLEYGNLRIKMNHMIKTDLSSAYSSGDKENICNESQSAVSRTKSQQLFY